MPALWARRVVRRLERQGFSNLLSPHWSSSICAIKRAVNYWFSCESSGVCVSRGWNGWRYPREFDKAGGVHLRQHDDSRHRRARGAPVSATKLLYLGSSCIYPRECPQPIKEEYLLTGPLEPTNESYALAKIAGIKLSSRTIANTAATSSPACRRTYMGPATTST